MPDGFDFTLQVRLLCEDFALRVESLRHIDMPRVAVSFSQTRSSVKHGMYASLTPLRFPDGKRHVVKRGKKWVVQRVLDPSGREMLYVLTFYLPRFLNLPFREKLDTVVHELWHISPDFDGDVRRLGKRCFAHGHSKKAYDAHVASLVDHWLSLKPPKSVYAFLESTFDELVAAHGRVVGTTIPTPKLIRLDAEKEKP